MQIIIPVAQSESLGGPDPLPARKKEKANRKKKKTNKIKERKRKKERYKEREIIRMWKGLHAAPKFAEAFSQSIKQLLNNDNSRLPQLH